MSAPPDLIHHGRVISGSWRISQPHFGAETASKRGCCPTCQYSQGTLTERADRTGQTDRHDNRNRKTHGHGHGHGQNPTDTRTHGQGHGHGRIDIRRHTETWQTDHRHTDESLETTAALACVANSLDVNLIEIHFVLKMQKFKLNPKYSCRG